MDKQEIQKQIDSISADRDALERTRNKLTGDIALLLQKIAEAEKPKLGHGDVIEWANSQIEGIRIAWESSELSVFETFNSSGKRKGTASPNPVGNFTHYFNIFDLMAGWDKDFETWESSLSISEVKRIKIKIVNGNIHFGTLADGAEYSLENIKEIWKQLGHAIVDNLRQTK